MSSMSCMKITNPKSRRQALSRFQENPTPHWGPGTRATIIIGDKKMPKNFRNQNKKQRHKIKPIEENETATEQELPEAKQPKLEQISWLRFSSLPY